ncbi:MAG TPA: AbrB/MazE/SpoVT family DNA-binding domain-containing protein [Terracidiphilus sp.]|nr:AbrB/MazE/SpoVT family DNA-binding domain-containing protein [Terracidiphilus sp.]
MIDIGALMSYCVINGYISMKIVGIQARINENGRIVIPAVIRKAMGLKLGDSVVLSLEDGVLRVEPQRARVRRVQERLGKLIPADRVLSEELIAEGREESRTEMEEWLG